MLNEDDEELTMSEVVDKWQKQQNAYRTEGTSGVENLEKLIKALDVQYNDYRFDCLREFLRDNSGCVEAMIEWIKEINVKEWKESLESDLHEDEEDPDEFENANRRELNQMNSDNQE